MNYFINTCKITSNFQQIIRTINHKTSIIRENRIMSKILTGKKKPKKGWYIETENSPKPTSVTTFSKTKGKGKESLRRVTVLNKLFMRNITDLMSSGSFADEISGRNIEISRVKVTSDFQRVNVYWIPNGNNDAETQELLTAAAIPIRHELSQLRVMGEVPKINFLKDTTNFKAAEIENILESLDLGEYLEEDCTNETAANPYNVIPKMRNDVFGLTQSVIMEKILKNMKTSSDAWERYEVRNALNRDLDKKLLHEESNNSSLNRTEDLIKSNKTEIAKFLERKTYSKKYKTYMDVELDTPNDEIYIEQENDDSDFLIDSEDKK